MRKFLYILISTVSLGAVLFFTGYREGNRNFISPSSKLLNSESAKGSIAYLTKMRANPETGVVDPADVARAREAARTMSLQKGGDLLQWEELGPNDVGGRTRAILIDKDNPNKIYAGGVSGGLFVSYDNASSWQKIDSSVENGMVAISSICQAADGAIYVGTGEGFYFLPGIGAGGIYGSGIYKSTDGVNFTLLPTTAPPSEPAQVNDDFATVDKLAASSTNPNYIYAAASGGIFMSTDGGATWAHPIDSDGNPISSTPGYDVKVGSDGVVHALVSNRYYRSIDGLIFSRLDGVSEGQFPTTTRRKSMAICESYPNYVYVVSVDGSGCLNFVTQSKDGGLTWQTIGTGSPILDPLNNYFAGYCQGDYDLAIGVDPNEPETVYIAGISLWRRTLQDGLNNWTQLDNLYESPSNPYFIHADKHEIIFRPGNSNIMFVGSDGGITRTLNATEEFPVFEVANRDYNVTQFYGIGAGHDGTVGGGTQDNGSQYLRYDFNSSGTALEVSGGDGGFFEISNISPLAIFVGNPDGALFRSSNGGDGFGSYFDCNIDCSTVDMSGTNCNSDGIIDGEADFVTNFYLWEDKTLFDKVNDFKFSSPEGGIQVINHNGQEIVISSEANTVPEEAYDNPYTEAQILVGYDLEENKVKEYAPGDYRYKRARMFTGGRNGKLWMTQDAINFGTTPFWLTIGSAGGSITAIDVSVDGNTVWAGTENGKLMRVKNVNSIPVHQVFLDDDGGCAQIASYTTNAASITLPNASGRYITDIAIDPINPANIVVVAGNYGSSNYVWVCTNANSTTPTFTPLQGDLPKMPIYDVMIPKVNHTFVLVATEFGIWKGDLNSSVGDWSPETSGMGAVPVFALREEKMARIPEAHYGQLDCYGMPILSSNFDHVNVIYAGVHGRGLFRTTSLSFPPNTYDFGPNCESFSVINLPQFNPQVITGIDDVNKANLFQVFPNPVNDIATMQVTLQTPGKISLKIYNMEGKLVRDLINNVNRSGAFTESVNLSNLGTGNYILMLQTPSGNVSRQLIKM